MNGPQPFLLAYDGVSPRFASAPAHAGAGAAVLGRATLGKSAWLGARSVIRADGHYIEIGDDFRLGARATVHIAHAVCRHTSARASPRASIRSFTPATLATAVISAATLSF